MEFLATLTSLQMPNETRARTVNKTMMMIAMTSFFFTMMGNRWTLRRAMCRGEECERGVVRR